MVALRVPLWLHVVSEGSYVKYGITNRMPLMYSPLASSAIFLLFSIYLDLTLEPKAHFPTVLIKDKVNNSRSTHSRGNAANICSKKKKVKKNTFIKKRQPQEKNSTDAESH